MDWHSWLTIFNQTLHIVVGLTYLIVMGRFLLIPVGLKKSRPVILLTRKIKVAITLCTVMQAADMLAFYQPWSIVCTSISVISALFAATSIIKLPEMLESLTAEMILGGIGQTNYEQRRKGVEDLAVERERYERLKARVRLLEDNFQRSGWISQSRNAMSQLSDLLADLEAVLHPQQETIREK